MHIIELREYKLVNISQKEKEVVLKISSNYYTSSKLQTLAKSNDKLETAFNDFWGSTHLSKKLGIFAK